MRYELCEARINFGFDFRENAIGVHANRWASILCNLGESRHCAVLTDKIIIIVPIDVKKLIDNGGDSQRQYINVGGDDLLKGKRGL